MRTIYFECSTGAAGDMILGCLTDLLDDPVSFVKKLNNLNIHDVNVTREPCVKNGISGHHIRVEIFGKEESDHHEHHHTTKRSVDEIIDSLNVSGTVKENAKKIYSSIASAESYAHNVPVDVIHFHEVGMLDAIIDIVGSCMLFEILNPECVIASPIRIGYGNIECAHGIVPVPTPATEYLLRGIPAFAGNIEGEFCTPTGIAILKYFVDEFKNRPEMITKRTGYGMGTRDFPITNCMRAFIGETKYSLSEICELSCNIDDMTAEDIAFVVDALLDSGALDVFITPIILKKGRPGSMVTCLCRKEDSDKFAKLILKHTSTIGVRSSIKERYEMSTHIEKRNVDGNTIHVKISEGFGIKKEKLEYEDIKNIALSTNSSILDIRKKI